MTRKLILGLCLSLSAVLLVGAGWAFARSGEAEAASSIPADQIIRVHFPANSDSEEDQRIKLAVRDAVMPQVTALLAGVDDRDEALALIGEAIPDITDTAQAVIADAGKAYPVTPVVRQRYFANPTATESVYLPAGEYTTLDVVLGQGAGHNWFSVLYPFLGGREAVTRGRSAGPVVVDGEKAVKVTVKARSRLYCMLRRCS